MAVKSLINIPYFVGYYTQCAVDGLRLKIAVLLPLSPFIEKGEETANEQAKYNAAQIFKIKKKGSKTG